MCKVQTLKNGYIGEIVVDFMLSTINEVGPNEIAESNYNMIIQSTDS